MIGNSSWRKVPIEQLFAPLEDGRTMHQGWSPQCEKEPAPTEKDWGVLKTTAIQAGSFVPIHNKQLPRSLEPRPLLEVKAGDILLTCAGPRIRCGIACLVETTRRRLMISGKMYRFRTNPEDVDPRYLAVFLRSEDAQAQIDRMKTGSSESGLNLTHERFRRLEVSIPPLSEQRRIVSLLSNGLAAVATAVANADRNLTNSVALFESRLKTTFEQDWERKPFREILADQPRNGWSPPSQYHTGFGNPVLTLSAVTGHEYDGDQVKMSSAPTKDEAFYWLRRGELLITRSNTRTLVGHVAIYDGNPAKAICCDLIMKMRLAPAQAITRFVYYFLRSPDARAYFMEQARGASSTMVKIGKEVVQNTSIPVPPLTTQRRVIEELDALQLRTKTLASLYQQKLAALDALKKSLLHQAFSGQLKTQAPVMLSIPLFPALSNSALTRFSGLPPDTLHAGVVAMSYRLHEEHGNLNEFGHVKAEKVVQMVEGHLLYEFDRTPVKEAAGPLDFPKRRWVDRQAKLKRWFEFEQTDSGRYEFRPLTKIAWVIGHTEMMLGPKLADLQALLKWMLPMKWQQAEIVATVYAGWNNLLLDGKQPTEEAIVYESRENWHQEKLKIERWRFFKAIEWLRDEGVVPTGKGKRVVAKAK